MSIEAMKQALEALEYEPIGKTSGEKDLKDRAITAIKEALAQPEQEPETLNYTVHVECKRCGSHERYDLEIDNPQRTWVLLTDDELYELDDIGREGIVSYGRKVQAKLKEKNT